MNPRCSDCGRVKERLAIDAEWVCSACDFNDKGTPASAAIYDPAPEKWKMGTVVTVTDEHGITRCRVSDTTIVTEDSELLRSFVLTEIAEAG